jgi:hypothetical protein
LLQGIGPTKLHEERIRCSARQPLDKQAEVLTLLAEGAQAYVRAQEELVYNTVERTLRSHLLDYKANIVWGTLRCVCLVEEYLYVPCYLSVCTQTSGILFSACHAWSHEQQPNAMLACLCASQSASIHGQEKSLPHARGAEGCADADLYPGLRYPLPHADAIAVVEDDFLRKQRHAFSVHSPYAAAHPLKSDNLYAPSKGGTK